MGTAENVTVIKERILSELSLGLLPDNYRLFHSDVCLSDDAYLIDYNVQDFDSLLLVGLSKAEVENYAATEIDSVGIKAHKCPSLASRMVKDECAGREDRNRSPSDGLLRMMKSVVRQIGAVSLCCVRSTDDLDDKEDDDRNEYCCGDDL